MLHTFGIKVNLTYMCNERIYTVLHCVVVNHLIIKEYV